MTPTLENVFVASLKHEGEQIAYTPFHFYFERKNTADQSINKSAIKAENVSKTFGQFHAVSQVNIEVNYGQIFGLLGANGAGKTTTIKMLCGLLPPSSGEMMLAGQVGALRDPHIRQRIGYMSQKFTLYDDLTLLENLEFYCGVYEVPSKLRLEKINWVLQASELTGQKDMLTAKLPGGWKQRLAFGACIMHEPQILFLDEPTSGVDPLARRQLWVMISDLAKHGTAILVTTHFMEEAEHCHMLGFMAAGHLVAQGSPSQIKANQPGQLVELITSDNQLASNKLKNRIEAWRVSIFADRLHIVLDDMNKQLPLILECLSQSSILIVSHKQVPFSLEDAFIGIIQRAGNISD